MKRNDLLTGEPFIAKRINHKFAKSTNRIKFHNRSATKLRHSVQHINKPLHKNLKILNEVMENTTKKKLHRQHNLHSIPQIQHHNPNASSSPPVVAITSG